MYKDVKEETRFMVDVWKGVRDEFRRTPAEIAEFRKWKRQETAKWDRQWLDGYYYWWETLFGKMVFACVLVVFIMTK